MVWHAIQTGVTREQSVTDRLALRHHTVFFPHDVLKRRVRSGHKFRIVEQPVALWPGYIFAQGAAPQLEQDGQCLVVRDGQGAPAVVPDRDIAVLLAGAGEGGRLRTVDTTCPHTDASVGDVVEVSKGVLSGFRCRVASLGLLADGLVEVEFNLFRSSRTVLIPYEAVGEIVQRAKACKGTKKVSETVDL